MRTRFLTTRAASGVIAVLAVLAIAAGCTATDTDLETAFCGALQDAPARTVTAATSQEASPPDVTDEQRVDIALVPDGTRFGGVVAYTADEAGSFAIGLSHDVDFEILNAAGANVPLTATVLGATGCDELAIRHSVNLDLETYFITFDSATADTISFVAEESDDDL